MADGDANLAQVVLGFDGSRDDSPLVIGRLADDGCLHLQVEESGQVDIDMGALLLTMRENIAQLCELARMSTLLIVP